MKSSKTVSVMEDNWEERNFDNLFLAKQNHLVVQKIFLFLDPKSLNSAAQVNSRWHTYIREQLWNRGSCRATLQQRLDHRWKNARPCRRTFRSGDSSTKVFDIKSDANDIVVSLENGSLEIWDKHTLTKRHSSTGHYTHGVRLGLHGDVIVAGFFDKTVDVWRRNSTDLNQNLENSTDVIVKVQSIEVESNIYVVKVTSDFAVVSLVNGSVVTFKINGNEIHPLQPHVTIEGSIRSAVRIDCQGGKLLIGNHAKVLSLWNLRDGSLIKSSNFTEGRISRVILNSPYGVCLSWSPDLEHDRLILLNVEQMQQLFSIDISGVVLAIAMDSRRIIVHTLGQEILHVMLTDLDKSKLIRLEPISGAPIGRALESRELILETDQIISTGSKLEAPGTIHVQNYWFGELEEDRTDQAVVSSYSPAYWLRWGLQFAYDSIRIAINLFLFLIGLPRDNQGQ